MAETQGKRPDHWLALESPDSGGSWGCRIESVGAKLPAGRLTTRDLMSRTRHRTRIQLERLTGIHERHVVGAGENSFTLAAGAARDCLTHSQHQASDIQMLISTSITRSRGRYSQSFEPPLSLYVKQAIGATQAANFDLSNACAGMLTGLFVLQDLIIRGEISCGMVVSGEYISHLSWNAARQIDMLINAGIYREDSMGEPALAALIQEDIRANPGQPPVGGRGTFSFDLLNGVCGVVAAIQIESGLLNSGVIRLGAIVTSDVDPDHQNPGATFPRPTGGALLLSRDDNLAGFTDFYMETFPEYEDLFKSGLVWRERHRLQRQATGQHEMVIEEKPGYQARLADCAEEASRRFLRRLGMGLDEIDLLVPAPSSPDFLDPLRARLGIPGDRVAYVAENLEGAYTTGPIAALQAAVRSGRFDEARTALVLTAGAGITVALALYRQVPPQTTPATGVPPSVWPPSGTGPG